MDDRQAKIARRNKRLALIVDEERTYQIRLAAVRAVLKELPLSHWLCLKSHEELLETVKRPWDTRAFLEGGRAVQRRVRRPPEMLADVW